MVGTIKIYFLIVPYPHRNDCLIFDCLVIYFFTILFQRFLMFFLLLLVYHLKIIKRYSPEKNSGLFFYSHHIEFRHSLNCSLARYTLLNTVPTGIPSLDAVSL